MLKHKPVANQLITGYWSTQAFNEASKVGKIHVVAKPETFTTIPDPKTWNIDNNGAYFQYCDNETIHGVEFKEFPFDAVPEDMPIIADMSSNFLSKPLDISKYGAIFASTCKNVAPSQ